MFRQVFGTEFIMYLCELGTHIFSFPTHTLKKLVRILLPVIRCHWGVIPKPNGIPTENKSMWTEA